MLYVLPRKSTIAERERRRNIYKTRHVEDCTWLTSFMPVNAGISISLFINHTCQHDPIDEIHPLQREWRQQREEREVTMSVITPSNISVR